MGVVAPYDVMRNLRPMGSACCPPVLSCWLRRRRWQTWPRLTVSDWSCYEAAVAPIDDVVKGTSWEGSAGDEVGDQDYIAPCGGAPTYEDREGGPEVPGHTGGLNYFGHRDPNPGTRRRTVAASDVSPFDGDYRTRLVPLPFLIGGCLLNL